MHFNWETLAHQPEMEHENAEILFTNIKPGGLGTVAHSCNPS
jgi:hypothetical protein